MVGEITKDVRSPLLPDRSEKGDFFVCDIFDAAPKADIASMAHPIFSLSTKPDRRIRRYVSGKDYVEVKPSAEGLATIHDRDVLIYCISQIIAKLNRNEKVSQTVRLRAFDLLKATNRVTDGRGYEGLKAALTRLQGTQIETNIVTGGTEKLDIFSIIDRATVVRETRDGRMQEIEVKLSDWVFDAINHKEVLTLNRAYFRLRKPLERRMYELARKHCGRQNEWSISLGTLQRKCGSCSTPREFKRLVTNIVRQEQTHNYMPDYSVSLEGDDLVVFRNRGSIPCPAAETSDIGDLDSETYHDARTLAPGWDIQALEREWRDWITEPPRDPDAAFLGFCRKWYERRGPPS
ncbi:MAG: replication initiator protein A [Geminicoccaceae bacterium]